MADLVDLLSLASVNSLDRFHWVNCELDPADESHLHGVFRPDTAERFCPQRCLTCSILTCFSVLRYICSFFGLLSEYKLKVSVWNTATSRLSRDVLLESGSDGIALFELSADDLPSGSQTYFYIEVIERFVYSTSYPCYEFLYLRATTFMPWQRFWGSCRQRFCGH
jgi:hypothetical protein